MRTCTRCRETKPLEDFALRHAARGRRQSWCRACHRANDAKRYRRFDAERLKQMRKNAKDRKQEVRRRIFAYLCDRSCVDCGEPDPVVLEFDHRREKRGNVSELATRGLSWEAIRAEIDKCEVRCANCHRRKTIDRGEFRNASQVRRPGQDSNLQPAASKAAALSVELPGQYLDLTGTSSKLRICSRCLVLKTTEDFYRRYGSPTGRHSWCIACHNRHMRQHYARNREQEIARVVGNRDKIVSENLPRLRRYLGEHPCVDCGESNPAVLEFDHQRDKRKEVTVLVRNGSRWATVEAEIAKCEVRCANCHRRRTARQQGYYREKLAAASRSAELLTSLRPGQDSNLRQPPS